MKIPTKQPEAKKERIAAWREHIPGIYNGAYRKQYDKAMSGKSLRAAVNAKCADCMNWQGVEVRLCDIVTCSLHPYRPGRSRQTEPVTLESAQQRASEEAGSEITPEMSITGGVCKEEN